MLNLPITPAERTELVATLRSSHRIRIGVDILNRGEQVVESLQLPASRMTSGTVTVDAHADITRVLDMVFIDPNRALGFDAASPAKGAVFADSMIAVTYDVLVPTVGWVSIPVFWGPVTNFDRQAEQVTIEAQGKEALGLDPQFATQGYTIPKGRRVDEAVRDIMGRIGETRFNLPDMPTRLPHARSVEPDDEPWDVVKFGWTADRKIYHGKGKNRRSERVSVDYNGIVRLAGHYYPYYNGRGRLCARRRTKTTVLAIKEGRDLVSMPEVSFDALAARNHVSVTGAKVTVGKKHMQRRGSATLAPGHPLSPYAIGRNGTPRYMTEFVTIDGLKTTAACDGAAQDILDTKVHDGLSLSFDMLPMPFLEELDYVAVQTSSYTLAIPMDSFVIPLTADTPMTVNYQKGDGS